ncbi:MAG TPA: hypothetical protein VEX35_09465 [Allosphingosinicella sp.]|nr:hypothetical protein [Allosphingosinicella sp.]
MAEKGTKREEFVSRGPVQRKVRKRRKDGWTQRDIDTFLAHYRVTSNIASSAAAAGKSYGSVFRLRDTDAGFAEAMDKALGEADVRLRSKSVQFAETQGKALPTAEGGEPVEAPLENFDPHLALKLLAHNRDRLQGRPGKGGPRPKSATAEELVQVVMRLLDMLDRRRAKRRAHDGI